MIKCVLKALKDNKTEAVKIKAWLKQIVEKEVEGKNTTIADWISAAVAEKLHEEGKLKCDCEGKKKKKNTS